MAGKVDKATKTTIPEDCLVPTERKEGYARRSRVRPAADVKSTRVDMGEHCSRPNPRTMSHRYPAESRRGGHSPPKPDTGEESREELPRLGCGCFSGSLFPIHSHVFLLAWSSVVISRLFTGPESPQSRKICAASRYH